LNWGGCCYDSGVNETEAKPKKSTTVRWVLIGAVALLLAPIAQCSIAATKDDPAKKPLDLTAEQAAGKCIGEMQLDYQAKGLRAVARTEDFSVTGNQNGQMGLFGKVTIVDLSSGGQVRDVNCLIEVISSGGSTTTSYRVH
jgi:hypothetical protein